MTDTPDTLETRDVPDATSPARRPLPSRPGPIGWLLNLFSSIWLGVVILSLLFIYSSIGSAGAPIRPAVLSPPFILAPDAWQQVRELRPFEMTEFEWFHWWPFDVLIALLCINLIVATVRRIPLRVINLGVWMIHTGIIILCIGSVIYFGTKVEGDSPIARRAVEVRVPGMPPAQFVARPGNGLAITAPDGRYEFLVSSIDPQWELLSGEDAGEQAYAVTVSVRTPTQEYQRQVIAQYPQYTEDVVRTDNPQQPFARAKKINPDGNPLVDQSVNIALRYVQQPWVYLMQSSAVYVREVGQSTWQQRPVEGLPRYNNYVQSLDDVFVAISDDPRDALEADPINIAVEPQGESDALGTDPLTISGYLRFASIETRQSVGGDSINPAISVDLTDSRSGRVEKIDLLAFDPKRNTAGAPPGGGGLAPLHFRWFGTSAEFDAYRQTAPPRLRVAIPADNIDFTIDVTEFARRSDNRPWQTIDGSTWQYRVNAVPENLQLELDTTSTASLAIVEYREDEEAAPVTRWVFHDANRTRDRVAEDDAAAADDVEHGMRLPDNRVQMFFTRSNQLPLMTLAAGPDPQQLRLILAKPELPVEITDLRVGTPTPINDAINLTARKYAVRTIEETRPAITPRAAQPRAVERMASMIQVRVPGALDDTPLWLPYHEYPFDSIEDVLLRFPYEPTTVRMEDGRQIELMFSRARIPLPDPVVLEDFEISSHIGGYTGATSSIADWTSIVRFRNDDNTWTESRPVSVNKPIEHGGFWYFQASWDPPVPSANSQGLNFTILGVGNRNGVYTQLAGCCIAVLGMIYAFYIKPMIKRRRQQAVYAEVQQMRRGERSAAAPVNVHANGTTVDTEVRR